HLQVIFAFSGVPQPTRWPNQTEWVDQEEDCAKCHKRNLEKLFARAVVHLLKPPQVQPSGIARLVATAPPSSLMNSRRISRLKCICCPQPRIAWQHTALARIKSGARRSAGFQIG